MASIRKTKRRLKKKLRSAEAVESILSHEYLLKRTYESLMEVAGARERIEYIKQELQELKRKKK